MPPSEMFEKIVSYANKYGDPKGAPYFSIDGKRSLTKSDWDAMRPKFKCLFGVTNVWTVNQLKGNERVKRGSKTVHLNQKPLSLIRRIIEMSSDTGDIVWDPFGGLFTTAVACHELNRRCYTSELTSEVYEEGVKRLEFDIAD